MLINVQRIVYRRISDGRNTILMKNNLVRDILHTVLIQIASFIICLWLQNVMKITSLTTGIFILATFLTSVITKGYVFGIAASVISVLDVNYAFTFPFFKLNFNMPENLISAIIMISVTLITSGLTVKLKEQEAIKAESEKEKLRTDLFRAVSHDLRTPLTTIYGASSALLEIKNDLTEEEKTKMLENIRQDSQWLFRMVENLLSITRIDAGNVKIIKTPIVLDELVDSVLLKFRKRYPQQKVDIDIPDDCVTIQMDAILIEQVIINILENAVQHAVGMTKLSLNVSVKADNAVFEIRDNGAGIPDNVLKNIFKGIYTDHEMPSDCKRSNAGIGMSVCSTIIKAHGGMINAYNAKDGGAIFKFNLKTEEDAYDAK